MPALLRRLAAFAAKTNTNTAGPALPHRAEDTIPLFGQAIDVDNVLVRRQSSSTGIIPTYYLVDGPGSGTIVGITLGSVAGFLFIIWLIFALANGGSIVSGGGHNVAGEEEIVVRRRNGGTRSSGRRSTRRSTREDFEVREVSVSRSPRRERVIVEERRSGGPPRRSRSIIVEERREHRVPGDDVVEVIEGSDYTPPPRRKGRRSSGYG